MDAQLLLEVLDDWNPWNRKLETGHGRPEYAARVLDLLRANVVVAVTGVRRSGKSTILRQAASRLIEEGSDPRDVLIVNLEDRRLEPDAGLLDEAFEVYLERVGPRGRPTVFLDEVHRVSGWERWVRTFHELGRARLVVSDSSSRLLAGELATLLTGRHLDIQVSPLSFGELLDFRGVEVRSELDLAAKRTDVRRLFGDYMGSGGFPEVVLAPHKRELLLTYLDDILTRDIEARYHLRRGGTLRSLARFYLANAANPVTFSSLARHLGTTAVTVERFSSFLEGACLVFFTKRFSFKVREQEKAARKVYAVDTGLANAAGFRPGPDRGRLAENLAAIELRREISIAQGAELYHWRDARGWEVDFVVTEGANVRRLVQVCWDPDAYRAGERETRALVKASRELGCDDLLVLTGGVAREEEVGGRTVRYEPMWRWLAARHLAGGAHGGAGRDEVEREARGGR